MSDHPNLGFGKLVPGFDFLQNLAKGASTLPQMPHLSNWVAPTLSVEELEKRISELKAVNFWLDQNSKALGATIQALEVQKMTLATLKGMNFNMGEIANALKLNADAVFGGMQKMSEKAAEAAGAAASASHTTAKAAAKAAPRKAADKPKTTKSDGAAATSLIDPMQWWGALTQQFQQIASSAMKDVATQAAMDNAKNMATGMAKEAVKTASAVTGTATATSGGHAGARKAPARRAAAKKARR